MTHDELDPRAIFIAAIEEMAAKGIDPEIPFSTEVFEPIASEFGIPKESANVARYLLNFAAQCSKVETKFHQTNMPIARKQLLKIKKLNEAYLEQLNQLLPETRAVLERTIVGTKLAPNFENSGDSLVLRNQGSESADNSTESDLAEVESINQLLASTTEQIEHFDSFITLAINVARGNKSGRPTDETLDDLLGTAFQVYVNFAGKPFTLDWHSDGEPLSDAAKFVVAIVKKFKPNTSLSHIATASRRIREKHIKVSSLHELPEFIANYNKRSS